MTTQDRHQLDREARRYAAEHGVTYEEALKMVAPLAAPPTHVVAHGVSYEEALEMLEPLAAPPEPGDPGWSAARERLHERVLAEQRAAGVSYEEALERLIRGRS